MGGHSFQKAFWGINRTKVLVQLPLLCMHAELCAGDRWTGILPPTLYLLPNTTGPIFCFL